MYLDKMTGKEVLLKCFEDANEIHNRVYNVLLKLKKLDALRKIYPYNKVYEIKCKSGNRYCLIIFIKGKLFLNKSGDIDNIKYMYISLFIDNAWHIGAYHLFRSPDFSFAQVVKLSYHFLKRYNERRDLHCTNSIDIISSFIIDEGTFAWMPEYFNEKHKDSIMMSSVHGGSFVKFVGEDMLVFKTFIDSESMTNSVMKMCDESYEDTIKNQVSDILYYDDTMLFF